MTEVPTNRCGYTHPEDYEVIDDPGQFDGNHESCCFRETLSDTDRCAWHADPDDTDEKTVKALREARVDANTREQTSPFGELLDGAILRGLELGDDLSLNRVALRKADLTDADLEGAGLPDANLRETDLSDAHLEGADLTGASLGGADLTGASLAEADLSDAQLSGADLSDAYLGKAGLSDANLVAADLSGQMLRGADLTDADLWKADLTDARLEGADLNDAWLQDTDLSDADLREADLVGADLQVADMTGTVLWKADLSDASLSVADLTDANLLEADLTEAFLPDADLSDADLRKADLTDADLEGADLTGASLGGADLTGANLEQATLIGTNLFDVDLTRIKLYGARFTGVQINDGTDIHANNSEYASWWQRGPLAPAPRCDYDLALREHSNDDNEEREKLLSRAADTYKQFEELAHDNTRPSLESSMFVRRQQMQRKLHRTRREPFQYAFAVVSGSVFNYGESLVRVFLWALLIIVAYAAVYARFDIIRDSGGGFIESPIDAMYFSTLTFTTLGLGDFQPDPASELARALVTSQAALGAILIALFVFVLGRRAAR